MEKDIQFLDFVAKSLVENTDAVRVERRVDEMGVLLTLHVSQEDMGCIIGRQGNTAKAIRTLLRIVGMHNDARVNMTIHDPLKEGHGKSEGMASLDKELSEI